MEGEVRPRKLQKLEHDGSVVSHAEEQNADLNNGDKPAVKEGQQPADNAIGSLLSENDTTGDNEEVAAGDAAGQNAPLSKKQQKRLLKMKRWDEQREERQKWRKEKRDQQKQRKKERKLNGEDVDAAKKKKHSSLLVPVTFVIDCGWDDLMNDRERISLGSQVTRAYSDNTRAPYRGHLVVSSFDKLLKERFDTVLRKTHKSWKGIRFIDEDFVQAAAQAKEFMKEPTGGQIAGVFKDKEGVSPEEGEIIYLSSDSSETLTELKPYSTYIIGGLVDKNRHKGVCYQKATELGIKTAKLPIGDYLRMASRHVLATNHVLEIMLKWLECGDWGQAFLEVIPQRKGGTLKTDDTTQKDEDEEELSDIEHTEDVGEPDDVETTVSKG
ncbi:guanine-1-methyltransferase-domain-containing protein [Talaromyces proteolyticus]|uniref:tRNA (guanine(9)-N1)-methyltransferase n=1 Tax=Talaromyces proteolyticus TaxID=1131652 RepID=A0AAD4KJX5_9EURO|nr:guanine-1-methyltransferase-domain-containing protein [Talaromyces proteolyticus]KAH8693976.1 guanine-1-methyltransferase-domain-containing protein [Talaromyces proteolyticus]